MKKLLLPILAALCFVSPSWAVIAHVRTVQCVQASNVTTFTCSLPTLPAAGNAVFVVSPAFFISAGTFGTPTNNQGDTFLAPTTVAQSTNAEIAVSCGIATAPSGTYTVTQTRTGLAYYIIYLIEVSGLTTCTVDTSDSKATSGGSTPFAAYTSALTTTAASTIVISAIGFGGTPTVNPVAGSGYAIPTNGKIVAGGSYPASAVEYKILTSTGTESPEFVTDAGTLNAAAVSVAFSASGGGGGGATPKRRRRIGE